MNLIPIQEGAPGLLPEVSKLQSALRVYGRRRMEVQNYKYILNPVNGLGMFCGKTQPSPLWS